MAWDQGLLTSHRKNSSGIVFGYVHHENHGCEAQFHGRLLVLVERLRLLGVEFLGIRSAGAGHAEEQLAPVGKRHVARVGALLVMVAGLVTIDHDFGSLRKRVLISAAAE